MGLWSKGRSRTETWAEPVERKYRRKAGIVLDSKTSSPGFLPEFPLPKLLSPKQH